MSEARPLIGIVIGHGALADGLVDAVRQIAGVGDDVLVPLSNRGLAPEAVAEAAERLAAGRPAIIFTDMHGGSCTHAARRFARTHPEIVVVGGVNLPMLLDFVLHRDLPPAELLGRLLTRGCPTVCYAPTGLRPDTGAAGQPAKAPLQERGGA
jgi:mannose/fructose-specific phosphotransferase system component IIA